MRFDILTMFPDFFTSPLQAGVLGSACESGLIETHMHHLVDFLESPKKRVDDTPYGGGAGMVFRPEPVARAVEFAKEQSPKAPVIHFSPRGKKLTQARLEGLVKKHSEFILLCGRYEGIDQRVLDMYVDEEYCVGDTILSGGEFPALLFIDSIARLIPGVLGNEASHQEESFSKELGRKKEYPHYTKPEIWRGVAVPEVLVSGHHARIKEWRERNLRS